MKRLAIAMAVLMFSGLSLYAQHSWSGIHNVSVKEAEANFNNTPAEYASHVIWGWEGPMDLETIQHDLDSIKTKGFRAVIFEAGYKLPYEYLSDQWFEGIRTGVMEAKKRGLKVWIIDEGKYPSGFAGGKFTKEKPEMRMKGLVTVETLPVAKGAILKDQAVPEGAFSAVAVSKSGAANRDLAIKDGKLAETFYAGLDEWDILFVGADYRTGQTRAVNNPTGGKDTSNSLCDYLSPQAVRQFIDWTHEQYKKYIGDEFGKTVLGFRGDEPDFAYTPWTNDMVEQFKAMKGYDPTPYIASLMTQNLTVREKRFKADYWDIWSQLFATNFFQQQADWCAENGLAHITHLNNDHNMPVCVKAEGNMFRDLSRVTIPGVDAIWNQIWPETINDFPKFASSVSHAYGKPRTFSESFAAYYTSPSIPQAKYVVDYQVVRGINFFEFMFWMAGSKSKNWMTDPGMKGLNDYTNRATYLMTLGKPGARIAVYYPTGNLWLSDQSHNEELVGMAETLLKHQKDFDWVDNDAFTEALTVRTGYFENLSGQKYYTLIIPSCDAIGKDAWAKIEEFAQRGGKVLFWGSKPTMLVGKTFMDPEPFPVSDIYYEEPSASWTATVASAMPEAEMSLILPERQRGGMRGGMRPPQGAPQGQAPQGAPQGPAPQGAAPQGAPQGGPMGPMDGMGEDDSTDYIRYTRRELPDASIFFLFNEGEKECSFKADLDAVGIVRQWDASTGEINAVEATRVDGKTRIEMKLDAWESKIIVIEKGTGIYNVKKLGVKGKGDVETAAIQAVIDKASENGGGTVVFPAGKYLTGALFFPDGVNLRIEKNAVVQGTDNPDDYPVIKTRFEGWEREWKCALLNFDNSKGVVVSGEGTVDGNCLKWRDQTFGTTGRPRLVCFTGCDGGRIEGLNLQNQASWCLHVLYTDGFTIDNLNINCRPYSPSSDGIDIDSSNGVKVLNTYIYCHDDNISIKSGKDAEGRRIGRPSEDILIENCHFAYGHGAVTMGSEISGGIRNVTARNCRIDGDNWAPIRFKSQPARGGVVENITFENFDIENVRNIFDVSLEWMTGRSDTEVVYSDPVTQYHNINVINCHGSGVNMGAIHGFKVDPLTSDVFHFENCSFTAGTALKVVNAELDTTGLEMKVDENLKDTFPGTREGARKSVPQLSPDKSRVKAK